MAAPVTPVEIGSLSATSPDESQFIGSSSGIFFANTVQRAFNISRSSAPSAFIGGGRTATHSPTADYGTSVPEEPFERPCNRDPHGYGPDLRVLGYPPDSQTATELIKTYFKIWHPLLPFLHGPTFLSELNRFYSSEPQTNLTPVRRNCVAIMLSCIFSVAALDQPDLSVPESCQIQSSSGLLTILGTIMSKHNTQCLQALLAAQVYFVATMSLQAASIVGGILLKATYIAGFHRCPSRYPQISQGDCDIRKRIFWSAYALDRYLSQALGHPLGYQDSDIDVCRPGATELHGNNQVEAPKNQKEEGLAGYVDYARVTGQALEIFHKSIHVRTLDNIAILELTSDVHSWWNNLPQELQESSAFTDNNSDAGLGFFFTIIYQQSILLINRPFLSLDNKTAQFRSSLQTCIGAGRMVISTLVKQKDHRLFWPGFLSAIWMSGLILAYACELDQYPRNKGVVELETTLDVLQKMGRKWSAARHCFAILELMLTRLRGPASSTQSLIFGDSGSRPSKRQRLTEPLDQRNPAIVQESSAMVDDWLWQNAVPDFDFDGSAQDIFGYLSWESMFQEPRLDEWTVQS